MRFAFDTASVTTRGFTGHEMLDGVGLVHMNGRVYDPEIGRFLSADPHIQEAGNFQNWNRYSYVLNNPLSYTDPSGFFFSGLFKSIGKMFAKMFKAIGQVIKVALKAVIQLTACAVNPILCVLAAGMGALIDGGSLRDALKAMVFSFASMGIWDQVGSVLGGLKASLGDAFAIVKMGVHGVIGGAMNVARGGSFLQGFASNALGAMGGLMTEGVMGGPGNGGFEGKLVRTLIAAAAGCAGAAVTGGKCAEGAITAGMAHLFNAESHPEQMRRLIAEKAQSYEGNEDWAQSASKGKHGPGTDKCNLFVYDVLQAVGLEPPTRGWPTSGGPSNAASWANPLNNIEGWAIVDTPRPGDIGASTIAAGIGVNMTGVNLGASGHVAVVTGDGTVATGTSSSGPIGTKPLEQVFVHSVTTYRRYIGTNQN